MFLRLLYLHGENCEEQVVEARGNCYAHDRDEDDINLFIHPGAPR